MNAQAPFKNFSFRSAKIFCVVSLLIGTLFSGVAMAQTVPGPADVSRLPQNTERPPAMPAAQPPQVQTGGMPSMAVPPGAENMMLNLAALHVDGVTVYSQDELSGLWRNDIGRTVSILRLYQIAAAITARYRRDGYALSRAFIPAQEIENGIAHISVVEGYIADIRFEGDMPKSYLLKEAYRRLVSERPLNIKTLERQMLLLNDLPGTDFRAVLKPLREEAPPPAAAPQPTPPSAPQPAPLLKPPPREGVPIVENNEMRCAQAGADPATCDVMVALIDEPPQAQPPAFTGEDAAMLAQAAPQPDDGLDLTKIAPAAGPLPPQAETDRHADDGGVMLVILGVPRPMLQANLSLDNAGSKYIGPYMVNGRVSILNDHLPYQQTTLSVSADAGFNELKNIDISHLVPLNANGLKFSCNAGYTRSSPGFTLEPNDVQSRSSRFGVLLSWTAVRQRAENFNLSGGLDVQNSNTDILGTPLVRDRTRSVKLQTHYDRQDRFAGTSVIEGSISHGLDMLGASEEGDADLSRAEGKPDYTKLEASAYRYQQLSPDWNAVFGATGQYSGTPLLSAQEFGFGGQAFGRAYDPSEIVGDQGCAFKTEIRYDGLIDLYEGRHVQPYLFYDIGKVWNLDPGQPAAVSAASAGAGLRYPLPYGINADLSLAKPLTRPQDAPQYGDGKAARFVFSVTSSLPP
ncbi:MAG: ShlB/FhaC/HecB family hemolysin secretion/activation protein [Alphaproteobacteria bacterium]|nr:MAG: ShlB/FhaC/HecB family hemolysin secretion/activation protein [Alphaproteobacteria bacterium]